MKRLIILITFVLTILAILSTSAGAQTVGHLLLVRQQETLRFYRRLEPALRAV